MKKVVHNLVTVGLLGGLALFVSGCVDFGPGKYTGGGVMDSAVEDGAKASLGFNMQALDKDEDGMVDTVKGQLQYKDRGSDVSLHGVVDGATVIFPWFGDKESIGAFTGTYRPQPKGESGEFTVYVFDEGEPGPSEEDSFTIEVSGGEYDGYTNSGLLNKGNIKFHE